uniref:Uncharacterized protein n=1 Tax=Oryza brachyantha TaxID=4533 RepID=J3MPJ5_ORYBR
MPQMQHPRAAALSQSKHNLAAAASASSSSIQPSLCNQQPVKELLDSCMHACMPLPLVSSCWIISSVSCLLFKSLSLSKVYNVII